MNPTSDGNDAVSDLGRAASQNPAPPRELAPRIESDPSILRGKPIIQGTRLSVELVLEQLASGYSIADVLDAYPFLSMGDLAAVFMYAARQVGAGAPTDREGTRAAS